jgi:lysine 2,3-aminomutase
LRPAEGLIWLPAGLPATPDSLAGRRVAAMFGHAPGLAAPPCAAAREVTLVPALPGRGKPLGLLPAVRKAAPEAVLRIEVWLEAPFAQLLAPGVLRTLAAAQPLFVHAVLSRDEPLPAEAGRLLRRLTEAGIPTAAEIVLQRGAIDRAERVRALCLELLRCGTRPYCLVDGVWLKDERRVPRGEALEIVRALRGWISGLAVPQLVEEGITGRRLPVIPPYVERLDAGGVEVVNYEGRRLHYANPPDERG